ncbi:MAG: Sua5/YciO/YrdC/YwlC family protein [Elusimicrobiota bacterium]|jgi:L-threonylcarbamoyladenylate synthase|nr:Sua5/YciO/YrdC/YwlC family protein [Elusimicrobiota bacterium]
MMPPPKTKIYNRAALGPADTRAIAAAFKAGAAAVLPTDTVYGLCAACGAAGALDKLHKIKNNPADKPPQILCSSEQALRLVVPTEVFLRAARLWPGALTIVAAVSPEAKVILGGAATVGLRVPADDFILNVIELCGGPLFATSANMHGAPVCRTPPEVTEVFDGRADIIVLGGEIKNPPSAVIDACGAEIKVIRQGARPLNI